MLRELNIWSPNEHCGGALHTFIKLYAKGRKKGKLEKEGKNIYQHLGFVFSNTFGRPHRVYKI